MKELLVPAFFAISALTVAWDVMVLGRIAKNRQLPASFRGVSSLGALLLVAALLILIASSTISTGRAVHGVLWLWPVTLLLLAIQSMYALVKRLVSPLVGVPIALLNVILFASAVARYLEFRGATLGLGALAIGASDANTLGLLLSTPALSSPLAVLIPMAAPAYQARFRISGFVRGMFASLAMAWVMLLLVQLPPAVAAVTSYERYANERLQERPQGNFRVGVRILPTLKGPPPALALRQDLEVQQTIDGEVMHVIFAPEGAKAAAIDSLARAIEHLRRDSVLLVVTLDYPENATEMIRDSTDRYIRNRMIEVDRIVRRLRPDYMLPAREPYGRGIRAIGRQPLEFWQEYYTRATAVTHRAFPAIKVGVSIGGLTPDDSALFVWAASEESPVNAVGFTLQPWFGGGRALEARLSTADRWINMVPDSRKEQWVWLAGGYPMAHGEESQERTIWRVLAWATAQPKMRGVIVGDAGDYSGETGLRAPGGRLRSAVGTVARAIRQLREAREADQ
jgi:hypothetical protein